ncbi:MAG: glycosyltransferase [Nitrospiraceae bacterium]|nr:glycosyltransferase [Nitrospiraceae bacterium]
MKTDRARENDGASVLSSGVVLAIAALAAGIPNAAFGLVFVRLAGAGAWSIASPLLGLGASAAIISTGIVYATTTDVVRAGTTAVARPALAKLLKILLFTPLCAPLIDHFLRLGSVWLALLSVVLFGVTLIAAIPTAALLALGRVRALAVLATLEALVRFALFIPVASGAPISGALLSSIAVTGLGAMAMWVWAVRSGPLDPLGYDTAGDEPSAGLLSRTILSLVLYLPIVIPTWFARHLLSVRSASKVAIAAYVATGIYSLIGAVTSAVIPKISVRANRHAERLGVLLAIGIGALVALVSVLAGPPVLALATGASMEGMRTPIGYLSAGALLWSVVSYLAWTRVTRSGRFGTWLFVTSVAVVVGTAAVFAHPTSATDAAVTLVSSAAALTLLATGILLRRIQPPEPAPLSEHGFDDRPPVSVGIMAHNEAALIGHCLGAFLRQDANITEVVVVVSGSTDETEEVVGLYASRDPRIRLVSEPERNGKLAAVQHFLDEAQHELCVVASADVVPAKGCVLMLVASLGDPDVSMVGPKVVPMRHGEGLIDRVHAVLWQLHHQVALRNPKVGELFAVRRSMTSELSKVAGCDEVIIEERVLSRGGRLAYVPAAIVNNMGPTSLAEYLRQRRRVHAQHLAVKSGLGYTPSTFYVRSALRPVLAWAIRRPLTWPDLFTCGTLEACGRLLGRIDHRRGKTHLTWQPSRSARQMLGPWADQA